MPILLDSAFAVGDADPTNSPYQETKIVQFGLFSSDQRIDLVTQMGNTVADVWKPGIPMEGKTVHRFSIDGADYDTLVAKTSDAAGEIFYDKCAEHLYQWLLDNDHFEGTIA